MEWRLAVAAWDMHEGKQKDLLWSEGMRGRLGRSVAWSQLQNADVSTETDML